MGSQVFSIGGGYGFVTVNLLEHLGVTEENERLDGTAITQSMKEAYCVVALECSVRYVRACPDKNTCCLFDDNINRILRGCLSHTIKAMAFGKRSHLFMAESRGWKDIPESAGLDAKLCERLTNMNTGQNALHTDGITSLSRTHTSPREADCLLFIVGTQT